MIAIPAPPDNPVRRFLRWTGSLKPVSLFYSRALLQLDRRVYELSKGRTTFSAWASGLQRTIGRRISIVRLQPWAR